MDKVETISLSNMTIVLTHISTKQCGIKRNNFDGVYETAICLNGANAFNASQSQWIHITQRLGRYRLRKKRVYAILPNNFTIHQKFYRTHKFDHKRRKNLKWLYNSCVEFTSEDYDKWQKCFEEKGKYILKRSNVYSFQTWCFIVNPFAKQARILQLLPYHINC